jgi:aspartyl/asparaginyl-tRNA synthetase
MYTYKAIKVKLNGWVNEKMDYSKIINREAADGWRLVQIVIPPNRGYIGEYEIIFEKEIKQ